jgi:hypothetical protein
MKSPSDHRLIGVFAIALLALCFAGIARAQVQPWDTNILTWTAPTNCTTGEPITACPVTSYRIEQAASSTGTFAALGAVPAATLTFSHTGATAGVHCYRVVAIAANGESPPSNMSCKTNVKPVGPPNAPTLKAIDTTAYNVVPNYQRFVFERGTRMGTVKLGAACDADRTVGAGYYVIARLNMVTPRPAAGTTVVAKCG